jgi:hypothetical protein
MPDHPPAVPASTTRYFMITTLLRTTALSALLLLAACDRQAGSAGVAAASPPMSLRVYTVPAERAEAIADALGSALGASGGHVSLAPPDRLIVVAPPLLQTSVAENLGELMKAAGPEAADAATDDSPPVRVVAWIVDVADAATVDPRLQPLQSTLEAVRETLAAPGFTLHAQLAVTANVGKRAGAPMTGVGGTQLHARLLPVDGGVHADIRLMAGSMAVETRTRLRFGETVVLAQAMPEDAGGSRVRLVIVRADPAI